MSEKPNLEDMTKEELIALVKTQQEQLGAKEAEGTEPVMAKEAQKEAKYDNLLEYLVSKDMNVMIFDYPENIGVAFSKMNEHFQNHNYRLSRDQRESLTQLGKEVLDFLKEDGVDINDFNDVRVVAGYDRDPGTLSSKEMGSYLAGASISLNPIVQNRSRGPAHSSMDPEFDLKDMTEKDIEQAQKLGQQVFGDNNVLSSPTPTLGKHNIDPDVAPSR